MKLVPTWNPVVIRVTLTDRFADLIGDFCSESGFLGLCAEARKVGPRNIELEPTSHEYEITVRQLKELVEDGALSFVEEKLPNAL